MTLTSIDLSVYLVTDSSLVPKGKTLLNVIEEAIAGGVTIVQLREKDISTNEFINLATQVREVTLKAGIPLIINDRVDVALAVDADGVHLGQSDMPLATARRLLGSRKIIGISVNTVEQAKEAVANGCDYLGIAACYATNTKKLDQLPIGPLGIRQILEAVPVGTLSVTIGGIKATNILNVLCKSVGANGNRLSGVAIVSDIITAKDVTQKVQDIKSIFADAITVSPSRPFANEDLVEHIVRISKVLKTASPLIHHITNFVVMNDTANATLALGGSPIMAQNDQEMYDLGQFIGALLLNIGTLNNEFISGMLSAGQTANTRGTPVVLDPVGAGASALRTNTMHELIQKIRMDVIKGNAGEISCLVGSDAVKMRGVDSVGEMTGQADFVKAAALQHNCVIAMTGKVDYVSDGYRTVSIGNGHEYMSRITGSGCMATTAIACFTAVSPEDCFLASVAALVSVGIAGEIAAQREDVKGPNTFRAAFLDELFNLNEEKLRKGIKINTF